MMRQDIAVVDTNVVSILSNEAGTEAEEYYRSQLGQRDLVVSFMTVHEVRWGIVNAGFGVRRTQEVLSDLERYEIEWVSEAFIDASVQLRWQTRHQQLSNSDLMIASAAIKLRCPFATDDRTLAEALEDAGIAGVISRHLQATN